MAKRFTDTTKWGRQNFRVLSPKLKLAWMYITDNCDHAGIWHADFELMSFQIGEQITEAEFKLAFGDKVQQLQTGAFFIPAFIEFQYGQLNPTNRSHASVLSKLEKIRPLAVAVSPLQGAKEQYKDKDKDQYKEKEKETEAPCEKKCLISSDPFVADALAEISESVQQVWLGAYGPDRIWIESELKRALAHWKTKGSKIAGAKLSWFLNNWLRDEKRKLEKAPAVASAPIAGKADKPPPPKLVEHLDPVTGELKVWMAQ